MSEYKQGRVAACCDRAGGGVSVQPHRVEDTAGVAVPKVQQLWVTPGLTSERFNPVKINKLESELRRCSVVIVDICGVVIDRFQVSNS